MKESPLRIKQQINRHVRLKNKSPLLVFFYVIHAYFFLGTRPLVLLSLNPKAVLEGVSAVAVAATIIGWNVKCEVRRKSRGKEPSLSLRARVCVHIMCTV